MQSNKKSKLKCLNSLNFAKGHKLENKVQFKNTSLSTDYRKDDWIQ